MMDLFFTSLQQEGSTMAKGKEKDGFDHLAQCHDMIRMRIALSSVLSSYSMKTKYIVIVVAVMACNFVID